MKSSKFGPEYYGILQNHDIQARIGFYNVAHGSAEVIGGEPAGRLLSGRPC